MNTLIASDGKTSVIYMEQLDIWEMSNARLSTEMRAVCWSKLGWVV